MASVILREFGLQPYQSVWEEMKRFTDQRLPEQPDEIWLTEHPPVYTLGLNGKQEHLLNTRDIPVIQTDRGGQVTYHGPGQLLIYTLINLKKREISVRKLVTVLEQSVVKTAAQYGITAYSKPEAPGVYIEHGKLASVGLRVRRNCSYHGLSVNIAMNTRPFEGINPCGFSNLSMVEFSRLNGPQSLREASPVILTHLCEQLGYTEIGHSLHAF